MSVLGHLFITYYAKLADFTSPLTLVKNLPFLIVLVVENVFGCRSLPSRHLAR
jgi:hypothetical protein